MKGSSWQNPDSEMAVGPAEKTPTTGLIVHVQVSLGSIATFVRFLSRGVKRFYITVFRS